MCNRWMHFSRIIINHIFWRHVDLLIAYDDLINESIHIDRWLICLHYCNEGVTYKFNSTILIYLIYLWFSFKSTFLISWHPIILINHKNLQYNFDDDSTCICIYVYVHKLLLNAFDYLIYPVIEITIHVQSN